jgi:hypothetical protein
MKKSGREFFRKLLGVASCNCTFRFSSGYSLSRVIRFPCTTRIERLSSIYLIPPISLGLSSGMGAD